MLLVIIQCEKPVGRRAIDTGSPLTILAPQSDSPIHFIEWYFGIKPLKSKSGLSVTFESVRFTPDYPGEYDVVVELFNDKNDVLEFRNTLGTFGMVANDFFTSPYRSLTNLHFQIFS